MPIDKTYKVGKDTYTIPESEIEGFTNQFPGAVEMKKFQVNDDTYTLPVNEIDGFKKQFPDALEFNEAEVIDKQEPIQEEQQEPVDLVESLDYTGQKKAVREVKESVGADNVPYDKDKSFFENIWAENKAEKEKVDNYSQDELDVYIGAYDEELKNNKEKIKELKKVDGNNARRQIETIEKQQAILDGKMSYAVKKSIDTTLPTAIPIKDEETGITSMQAVDLPEVSEQQKEDIDLASYNDWDVDKKLVYHQDNISEIETNPVLKDEEKALLISQEVRKQNQAKQKEKFTSILEEGNKELELTDAKKELEESKKKTKGKDNRLVKTEIDKQRKLETQISGLEKGEEKLKNYSVDKLSEAVNSDLTEIGWKDLITGNRDSEQSKEMNTISDAMLDEYGRSLTGQKRSELQRVLSSRFLNDSQKQMIALEAKNYHINKLENKYQNAKNKGYDKVYYDYKSTEAGIEQLKGIINIGEEKLLSNTLALNKNPNDIVARENVAYYQEKINKEKLQLQEFDKSLQGMLSNQLTVDKIKHIESINNDFNKTQILNSNIIEKFPALKKEMADNVEMKNQQNSDSWLTRFNGYLWEGKNQVINSTRQASQDIGNLVLAAASNLASSDQNSIDDFLKAKNVEIDSEDYTIQHTPVFDKDGSVNWNRAIMSGTRTIADMAILIGGGSSIGKLGLLGKAKYGRNIGTVISGYNMGFQGTYEESLAMNPDNKRQAYFRANTVQTIVAALELVSPNTKMFQFSKQAIKKTAYKDLVKNLLRDPKSIKKSLTNYSKAMGKELAKENIQEISQTLAELGLNSMFNNARGTDYRTDFEENELKETILMTTIATMFMGGVTMGKPGTYNSKLYSQSLNAATDSEMSFKKIKRNLLQGMEEGKISKERLGEVFNDLQVARDNKVGLRGMSLDKQTTLTPLFIEEKRLKAMVEVSESDAVKKVWKEKLKVVQEEIANVWKTPDGEYAIGDTFVSKETMEKKMKDQKFLDGLKNDNERVEIFNDDNMAIRLNSAMNKEENEKKTKDIKKNAENKAKKTIDNKEFDSKEAIEKELKSKRRELTDVLTETVDTGTDGNQHTASDVDNRVIEAELDEEIKILEQKLKDFDKKKEEKVVDEKSSLSELDKFAKKELKKETVEDVEVKEEIKDKKVIESKQSQEKKADSFEETLKKKKAEEKQSDFSELSEAVETRKKSNETMSFALARDFKALINNNTITKQQAQEMLDEWIKRAPNNGQVNLTKTQKNILQKSIDSMSVEKKTEKKEDPKKEIKKEVKKEKTETVEKQLKKDFVEPIIETDKKSTKKVADKKKNKNDALIEKLKSFKKDIDFTTNMGLNPEQGLKAAHNLAIDAIIKAVELKKTFEELIQIGIDTFKNSDYFKNKVKDSEKENVLDSYEEQLTEILTDEVEKQVEEELEEYSDVENILTVDDNKELSLAATGAQKLKWNRDKYRKLWDQMKEKGIENPELMVLNLFQTDEKINKALKNEDEFNKYLLKLNKSNSDLANMFYSIGLKSARSMRNQYSNMHMLERVKIISTSTSQFISSSNKENKYEELKNIFFSNLNNFLYKSKDGTEYTVKEINEGIKAIYNDRKSDIENAKTLEEKHEIDLQFLENLTGIGKDIWAGYFVSENNEGTRYIKQGFKDAHIKLEADSYTEVIKKFNERKLATDKPVPYRMYKGKPYPVESSELIQILTNPTSLRNIESNAKSYITKFFTEEGKVANNLIKLANVTQSQNDTKFNFSNVNGAMESSVEATSGLTQSAEEILGEKYDDAYYKNNEIVQEHRKNNEPLKLTLVDGLKNNNTKKSQIAGKMTEGDLMHTIISLYAKSTDRYNQFLGLFGGKKQMYSVEVKKYTDAKKKYVEIYNNSSEKDKMISPKSMLNKNSKDYKNLRRIVIGNKAQLKIDNTEKFIENFLFNYAINKYYSDQIFFGKYRQYKDAIEMIKRAQSTNSPGQSLITGIDGGLEDKFRLLSINDAKIDVFLQGLTKGERKLLDGMTEQADGLTIMTKEFAKMIQISMGNVLSQEDTYPELSTSKIIYSDVDKGDRDLIKSNWLVVEDLIKLDFAKNSLYSKLNQLMVDSRSDVLTFESGQKKNKGKLLDFFKENSNKTNSFTAEQLKEHVREADSKHILIQQDLRHSSAPKSSKQPTQMIGNTVPLSNSDKIAKLYKESQQLEVEEFIASYGELNEKERREFLLKEMDEDSSGQIYQLIKAGVSLNTPYIKNFTDKVISSYISRRAMERKSNRVALIEVPELDIDLPQLRQKGDKLLMPECACGIDGIRYSNFKYTDKESAEKEYEKGFKNGKYKDLNKWEIYEQDGKWIIPGEYVMVTRVPAGDLSSHTLMRAGHRLPESMGNIIITDKVTQLISGADFDGDKRFAEVMYRDKDGNIIEKNKKGLINEAMMLLAEDYHNPKNYDILTNPINLNLYDDTYNNLIDSESELDKGSNASNDFFTYVNSYNKNNVGTKTIGVTANLNTAISYIKKHKIGIKEPISKIPLLKTSKNGLKNTGKFREVSKFNPDPKNIIKATINNLTNMALDNAKDPKIEVMGLNEVTSNMFIFLLATDTTIRTETDVQRSVDEISALMNTDLYKEFISLIRKKNDVKSVMTNKEIFEKLEIENGKKHVAQLKQIYYSAGELAKISQFVNLTRKLPSSYVEYLSASKVNSAIMNNGGTEFKNLDIRNFIRNGEISDFVYMANESLKLAKEYVYKDNIEETEVGQEIILSSVDEFNTNTELQKIFRAVNTTAGIVALNNGQDFKSLETDLTDGLKDLKEEYPDNKFFDSIQISINKKEYRLQALDDITRVGVSEELKTEIQKDFNKLPVELQDKFGLYVMYRYGGISASVFNGNFSAFFDVDFHKRLGDILTDSSLFDGIDIPILIERLKKFSSVLDNNNDNKNHSEILDIYKEGSIVKSEVEIVDKVNMTIDELQQIVNINTVSEFNELEINENSKNKFKKLLKFYQEKYPDGKASDYAEFLIDRHTSNIQPKQNRLTTSNSSILNEALASSDVSLQEYIIDQLQEMYPGIQIFKSQKDFMDFVEKNGGDTSNLDFDTLGAAFGNTIYIDEKNAIQSTFFHENAHIYFDALPDDNKTKQRLIELFEDKTNEDIESRKANADEDAIIAIGIAGVDIAEIELRGTKLDKFKILLKNFWIDIKKMFKSANKQDLVHSMAWRIWKNKDNLNNTDFIETIVKRMIVKDYNDITFDSGPHKYYDIDGLPLASVSTVKDSFKRTKFNPITQAATSTLIKSDYRREHSIRKESDKTDEEYKARVSNAYDNLGFTDKEREVQYIGKGFGEKEKAESSARFRRLWKFNENIGTDLHDMVDIVHTDRGTDERKQEVKDRFETEKDYNDFRIVIEEKMKELNPNGNNEFNEKVVGDPDNHIAGMIDYGVEYETDKYVLYDFKTAIKPFYNEDGTLHERITKTYTNETLLEPFNNSEDNLLTGYTIQTNVYGRIVENTNDGITVDKYGIVPINYDLDEKTGKIKNVRFEKTIDLKHVPSSSNKMIEINKGRQEVIKEQQLRNKEKTYEVSKIALKEEEEAISTLISGFDIDLVQDNIKHILDTINKGRNLKERLSDKGFSKEEISNLTIHELLSQLQVGAKEYNPSVKKEEKNDLTGVKEGVYPTLEEWMDSNKYGKKHTATPEQKTHYIRQIKIMELIYKDIGSIGNLETESVSKLEYIEERLRGVDKDIAGPLMEYVTTRLAMNIIVESAKKEMITNTESKPSTVLLSQILTGKLFHGDISNNMAGSKLLMTDRHITGQHKLLGVLTSLVREATNMTEANAVVIQKDMKRFRKLIKRGVIRLDKISHVYKNRKMFIDPDTVKIDYLNKEEIEYLEYIKESYKNTDPYYRLNENIAIPVPSEHITWRQSLGKFGLLKYRVIYRLTKPTPYDNTVFEYKDEHYSFKEYKQILFNKTNGLSKLSWSNIKELKKVNKIARDKFNSLRNSTASIQRHKKQARISGTNTRNILLENNKHADIMEAHLISKARKYNMEKVLPYSEYVIEQYDSKNTGNIKEWAESFSTKQITNKLVNRDSLGGAIPYIKKLMTLAAWRSLAFGIASQPVNLGIGQYSNFVYMGYKFLVGWQRMLTHPKRIYDLIRDFGIVNVVDERNFDTVDKVMNHGAQFAFFLTTAAEFLNQGIALAGQMTNKEFSDYGKDGMKTFSEQRRNVLEDNVRLMHGDYGLKNAAIGTYTTTGQAIAQFKRWLPAYLNMRYGKSYIDARTGVHKRGFWSSALILLKVQTYNMLNEESKKKKFEKVLSDPSSDHERIRKLNIQQYIKENTKTDAQGNLVPSNINYSELSETDRKGILRLSREIFSLAATYMLLSGAFDDDKKKLSKVERLVKDYYIDRLYGDIWMSYESNSLRFMLSNPVAIIGYTADILDFLDSVRKSDKYKTGKKEGEYKFINKAIKIGPGGSGFNVARKFLEAANK